MYHIHEFTAPPGYVQGYAFLDEDAHTIAVSARHPLERLRPGRVAPEVVAHVVITGMEVMAESGFVNVDRLMDTERFCDDLPPLGGDVESWVSNNSRPA